MLDEDLIRRGTLSPAPTTRELAMVLFRRRRVFVRVAGMVLVAAVLYACMGTKYQSNLKVLVRKARVDAPVSAAENAPFDLTRLAITEEELNSEVELLRDDEVLRKVVEENSLADRDWLHFLRPGEGRAQRVERAARRLAKKLDVDAVKKTDLIAISYASGDPQLSAKVLQSLANAYLEKHMKVHRPSGEFPFFAQQTGESQRQLEESERNLLQFTEERGVVAAAQQRDLALVKLSDIDASYRQAAIDLAETRQRVRQLQAQLTTLPERTTTQVRTADNPELLRALKATLLDLQLKRTELLAKFEPTHRMVHEVEQQIAQTETAIAGENLAPVRDETTDKDAQHEWAKSELQHAQVQLKALEARAAATGVQEAAYRTMTRQLGKDALTQDDLLNAEKAAQENYLLYVKKREEARIADALDERGIVDVAIAEQPVAPALPVWPAWAVLGIGLVAAGGAGTGAAFAADYMDPAFRTPDDVLLYLNTPVLASLPRSIYGELSA